ncbi:MAG: transposase [Gammaproteobacteria bacterium]|nr:transposase [Gammaproteobacteria bacterium]
MNNRVPFFAFASEVREIKYTTNPIESLHSGVRRTTRNKGHSPSDEAATKLIWLGLRNITAKWRNPPIAPGVDRIPVRDAIR